MVPASSPLVVGFAQIAPVWLDREATLKKVVACIHNAADQGAQVVGFGECLVPGYPFWIELTDGARFNDNRQKEIHAEYLRQAVTIEEDHLRTVQEACAARHIMAVLGILEKPRDRGESVYACCVVIGPLGDVLSAHRKLMPTYEERLTWSIGDGHGLRTHRIGEFTLGALNCWENWMPLARAALYGQGEDLHVAIWPGSKRNTDDLTRFIAKESRSYVLSVSGLMRPIDFPQGTLHRDAIVAGYTDDDFLTDGGSCLAAPDG
ncbi:MAG: nitrilase-related carbon-nitrogen hydrolase, partial [Vicinamibacteria bacterium]